MNASDSERIAAVCAAQGWEQAASLEEADLVIYNLCSVRQTAVDRLYGQFNQKSALRRQGKEPLVFLTGCILDQDKEKLAPKVAGIFSIKDLPFFPQIVAGQKEKAAGCASPREYLKIKPLYKYNQQVFLPIMTGCNNFCSYCVVPYTRGREWSRPLKDIQKEIEELQKNKVKEIVLLGQNVNSYQGKDLKEKPLSFAQLLDFLINYFPQIKFSFLTSHPKDMSDELIEVLARYPQRISRSLHLPFQAGSDRILKMMRRGYTQKDYLDLVAKIKQKAPDIVFSTDVIVGFPTEKEEDFQETLKVIEQVGFQEVFINKYSPRPGTLAYRLYPDDISWEEKKKRWRRVAELVEKINQEKHG